MVEIHGSTWSSPAEITIENSDTVGLYDMAVALRHNGLPADGQIEVTIRTVTPDSMWVEEPLAIRIGDDGRSRPAQHEAWALYRRRVRLSREGAYRIIITPTQAVSGVTAVGVDMTQRSDSER